MIIKYVTIECYTELHDQPKLYIGKGFLGTKGKPKIFFIVMFFMYFKFEIANEAFLEQKENPKYFLILCFLCILNLR